MTVTHHGRTHVVTEADLILSQRIEATKAYFDARGEDPVVFAPEFFVYHCKQGESPAQIFAIATNRREVA